MVNVLFSFILFHGTKSFVSSHSWGQCLRFIKQAQELIQDYPYLLVPEAEVQVEKMKLSLRLSAKCNVPQNY